MKERSKNDGVKKRCGTMRTSSERRGNQKS